MLLVRLMALYQKGWLLSIDGDWHYDHIDFRHDYLDGRVIGLHLDLERQPIPDGELFDVALDDPERRISFGQNQVIQHLQRLLLKVEGTYLAVEFQIVQVQFVLAEVLVRQLHGVHQELSQSFLD